MNALLISLLISLLIILGILLYNPAKSFGIPAAIIFIGVGLFIGNKESIIPMYDFPNLTETISQFALGLIIFTGGLLTPLKKIKPVLTEGLLLSNLAVLLTAISVGILTSLLTPLSLTEGLLLGAIVSSTDAASVFSIIETRKIKLKYYTDRVLELESATNDPMAMILTLGIVSYIQEGGGQGAGYYIIFFLQQVGVGLVIGVSVALILRYLFHRIRFQEEGLIPVLFLAVLLMTTSLTQLLGGNILLSCYILGLMISEEKIPSKKNTIHFYNSFSWLAQALMFILLGLQLFPGQILKALSIAWIPTLLLFFVGRPLGVLLCYLPFRKTKIRKKIFISWIGMRGATPIVFALIPVIKGIPNSNLLLDIVAVIVISSILLHGFTLKPVARWLKLLDE